MGLPEPETPGVSEVLQVPTSVIQASNEVNSYSLLAAKVSNLFTRDSCYGEIIGTT